MSAAGRRAVLRAMRATVACAVIGLAGPAAAGAYLRDVQTLQSQTTPSSEPVRTLLTGCPAGQVILGTGASAVPGASGVDISGFGLTRMWPAPAGGTSALLSAVEADPVTGSWLLFAQRQCVTQTATAPTAATNGPYVKDTFLASTASAFNSISPKQVSTACQGGRQSIGGGFRIQASSGLPTKTAVRRAVRVEGGFVVNAHETVPTGASWNLTAFAVCANLGNVGARQATYANIPGGNTTISVADVNRNAKQAAAGCPPGQKILGGGAEVLGHIATTLPPGDVVLTGSWPTAGGGAWLAEAVEETPTPRNWRVAGRAICASTVVG